MLSLPIYMMHTLLTQCFRFPYIYIYTQVLLTQQLCTTPCSTDTLWNRWLDRNWLALRQYPMQRKDEELIDQAKQNIVLTLLMCEWKKERVSEWVSDAVIVLTMLMCEWKSEREWVSDAANIFAMLMCEWKRVSVSEWCCDRVGK